MRTEEVERAWESTSISAIPPILPLIDNKSWLKMGRLDTQRPVAPAERTPGRKANLDVKCTLSRA